MRAVLGRLPSNTQDPKKETIERGRPSFFSLSLQVFDQVTEIPSPGLVTSSRAPFASTKQKHAQRLNRRPPTAIHYYPLITTDHFFTYSLSLNPLTLDPRLPSRASAERTSSLLNIEFRIAFRRRPIFVSHLSSPCRFACFVRVNPSCDAKRGVVVEQRDSVSRARSGGQMGNWCYGCVTVQ